MYLRDIWFVTAALVWSQIQLNNIKINTIIYKNINNVKVRLRNEKIKQKCNKDIFVYIV